jgi:two-component system, OmpR family, sensor histidine kinase BaeS
MRLHARLFVAIALPAVAALLLFAVLQQRAMHTGFERYLTQNAVVLAQRRSADFIKLYARDAGWQSLRANPMQMGGLLDGHEGPPRDAARPPAASRQALGPPPEGELLNSVGRRLQLVDAKGIFVAGNPAQAPILARHALLQGATPIGELRVLPFRNPPRSSEAALIQGLRAQTLLAASLVLLAAAAIALYLARSFNRPIQALANAAKAMAAGDYQTRVPVVGKAELAELCAEFNVLGEALASHQQARARFGQDLAHELRTPLTVLSHELQTLLDGVRPSDSAALQSLMSETKRMARLIDDFKELANAETAALTYRFSDVDLSELVAETLQRFDSAFSAAKISLRHDLSARVLVRADPDRLMQLLDNLLSNSLRYTHADGACMVRLVIDDATTTLCVHDSAPGVQDAELERIFERLYRADPSRARASGGSGLGLAIAQAIARAHHGTLRAAHSDFGGLSLCLSLPRLTH